MREDLLAIMREIFERNAFAERLACSPDEAAELLGISRDLVHDLLRTGQLGSVKAGRRRLVAKHHLEAFLAGQTVRQQLLARNLRDMAGVHRLPGACSVPCCGLPLSFLDWLRPVCPTDPWPIWPGARDGRLKTDIDNPL